MKNNVEYLIHKGTYKGNHYRIEGLWHELTGETWREGSNRGNPACLQYHARVKRDELPVDDRVFYGKIGCLGHLIHASELKGE